MLRQSIRKRLDIALPFGITTVAQGEIGGVHNYALLSETKLFVDGTSEGLVEEREVLLPGGYLLLDLLDVALRVLLPQQPPLLLPPLVVFEPLHQGVDGLAFGLSAVPAAPAGEAPSGIQPLPS